MRSRNIPVHMAHMPGQCAAAQHPNGKLLFTSGVDGTLRPHDIADAKSSWWRTDNNPQEPDVPDLPVSDMHDKPVTALSITPSGNNMATASVDGFVRIFSVSPTNASSSAPSSSSQSPSEAIVVPTVDFVQACARFAGPVRALHFSPTGSFLAAAGDEPGLLKIIMTSQPTSVNVLRAPETSPANDAIIAVQFDPRGDVVVTIGERGTVAVWDIDKCALVRTIDLNGRKASSLSWAPDADSIMFGTDRGAVVVSRDTWVLDYLLEDIGEADDDGEDDIFSVSASKDDICAVSWSANGRYALTARKDSNVALWDVYHKKVLGVWKMEQLPQSVQWHCKANAFVVLDVIGQWGIVSDVVPSHMPNPHSDNAMVDLPSVPDVPKTKKKGGGDAEDPDDCAIVKRSKRSKMKKQKLQDRKKKAAAEKEKSAATKPNAEWQGAELEDDQELENNFKFHPSDIDADDEDNDDDAASESLGSRDSEYESGSDEEVPGELADLENAGVRLPELKRKSRSHREGHGARGTRTVVAAPDPFMSSSTPASEKTNKKARILVWNLVGAVLSFDESTHDVVEIEFADAAKRTIGIKDHFGYSLGCLSETGVFLAAVKTKDHGAVVSFRPFSSWAQNPEWTQFMPADEDISVIALGKRFTAVATLPNNIVRLFSMSGLQTAAFGVPGTIVTAAAAGDMLAIVFCETGSMTLKCELMEISSVGEPASVLYSSGLMISGGSQLEWLGFTNDTSELCVYDSKGWLWVMCDARATKRWVPQVQNAAKSAECDWFWVASATSTRLLGAPCLSNERYPTAKPRPALTSVLLSAPVIERVSKSGATTVTERLGRTRLSLQRAAAAKLAADDMFDSDAEEVEMAEETVARVELEADKCTLALMEDACKHEQNMRALDLATRLHCKVSFKYAIELARHFKRNALAARVEHVAAKKIAVIEDDEEARRIAKGANGTAAGLGTSPVSMQHNAGAHMEAEHDVMDKKVLRSTSVRRMTRMQYSDDDEEAERQSPLKTPVVVRKELDVRDVTDDEEEPTGKHGDKDEKLAKNRPSQSAANMESKENRASTAASDKSIQEPRGKKRRASVPEPQVSQKVAATTTTTSSVKKAKVEVKVQQNTASADVNKRFGASFRNRFLKK